MYGCTDNTARHHCLWFAETKICYFPSISLIQLKIKYLKINSDAIIQQGQSLANTHPKIMTRNVLQSMIHCWLTYKNVFQFDITMHKALAM